MHPHGGSQSDLRLRQPVVPSLPGAVQEEDDRPLLRQRVVTRHVHHMLQSLNLRRCTGVTDLTPLAGLKTLRALRVDRGPHGEKLVRGLLEALRRAVRS